MHNVKPTVCWNLYSLNLYVKESEFSMITWMSIVLQVWAPGQDQPVSAGQTQA